MNWGIIGHEKQVSFLQKSIRKNRLSHAYLFIGPQGVGKTTLALAFAKALQCEDGKDEDFCSHCQSCLAIEKGNHPDVHLISPESEKEEISIAQIRKLRRDFTLSALSGLYKIGVVQGADLLGRAAANAFLKTLEEPLGKAIFILTSSSESILPTISSRCQILKFPSLSIIKVKEELKRRGVVQAERLARVSRGRPGLALNIIKNPEILETRENLIKDLISILASDNNYRFKYAENLAQDKLKIKEALSCWMTFFRDILIKGYIGLDETSEAPQVKISKEKSFAAIKKLRKTYDIISSTNVNPRLALEVLMLNL